MVREMFEEALIEIGNGGAGFVEGVRFIGRLRYVFR